MKILAVCGSGLGSSFMLEMNIKEALKKMGIEGVKVDHSDLSSLTKDMADYIVCGKDIAMAMKNFDNLVILDNILDKTELTGKLKPVLSKEGLL